MSPKNRPIVLAIAYTESSLDYSVKHPTDDLSGVGGFKSYWKTHCKKLGITPNSLQCIESVYLTLVEETGSEYKALCKYKGAVENLTSVRRTLKIKAFIQRRIHEL